MKTALQLALLAGLGACGIADIDTGQTVQDLTYGNNVFYEKFDPLAVGTIGGQSGWTGDCAVAAATAPDKNLRCTGAAGLTNGRGAMRTFSRPLNVDYHLQFDVWTEGVTDSTHGKVFLEAPPGDGTNSILQIAIGCDNIRATFEYHANTTQGLLAFPCSNGTHYRVVCLWRDHGDAFHCGASVYPQDPDESNLITIRALDSNGAPEAIGPFDRIRVLGGIGQRLGTTIFDKVQVLSD